MSYELSEITVVRYPAGSKLGAEELAYLEDGAICVWQDGKFELEPDPFEQQLTEITIKPGTESSVRDTIWHVTMRDIVVLKPWQAMTMIQAEREAAGADLLNDAAPELCVIARRHFDKSWPPRMSSDVADLRTATSFVALWDVSFTPGDGWNHDDEWSVRLHGELDMSSLHRVNTDDPASP